MFRGLITAVALLIFSAGQMAAADGIKLANKDPAYLTISGGWFDFNRQKDQGGEFSLEYRSNFNVWWFKPFLHGAYVTNGMSFVGAGVLIDIEVGDNWIIQPSFAPTYWQGKTDDLDLGHELEFRSRLEIAYRFRDKSRLGFSISHSSNASIGDTNPGTESLMVNVSIPLGK